MRTTIFLCCCLLLFACHTTKKTIGNDGVIIIPSGPKKDSSTITLQQKYAKLLGVAPAEIRNLKLYRFVDEWLNTPYKWGGTNKQGVDCSSFVQQLLTNVYGVSIPRTSEYQFFDQLVERFANTAYAAEGDLLFFKTLNNGHPITHVGLYLNNNKFVNASSKAGVSIADLANPYWKNCYVGSGRFRVK